LAHSKVVGFAVACRHCTGALRNHTMDRPSDEKRNGCRLGSPEMLRVATLCPRTLFYASTRGTAPDYSEKYVSWYRSGPNVISDFVFTILLPSPPRRVVARSVKPAFVLQAVNVAFPLNQDLWVHIGSGRLFLRTEVQEGEGGIGQGCLPLSVRPSQPS
jgi:hypothetical protein